MESGIDKFKHMSVMGNPILEKVEFFEGNNKQKYSKDTDNDVRQTKKAKEEYTVNGVPLSKYLRGEGPS